MSIAALVIAIIALILSFIGLASAGAAHQRVTKIDADKFDRLLGIGKVPDARSRS